MERKLDQSSVEQYSEEFTEKTLSSAYANNEKLNGKAILQLTPVKQVNLLVIKSLFDQWQMEIDKLRSPYFDYSAAEVQEVLDNFINTLSQHISVDREHLQPLVVNAVKDTLYLVFDPATYYRQQLSQISEAGIRETDLLTWLKYIRINRSLLEAYVEEFRQQPVSALDQESATRLLDATSDRFSESLDAFDPHVAAFSEVYSFVPEQLLVTDVSSEPDTTTEEIVSPSEVETIEAEEEQPAIQGPRTLHDFLTEKSPASTTLEDIQKKHRIGSIREYIGVNQRYMFIRELFGNNPQEYQQAISSLDQKQSYVEAFNFLRHEFAQKYHWKMDSEEVVELLEIVSKRYN